jgi:RimJ/RimL family protein N-acetyltransferase
MRTASGTDVQLHRMSARDARRLRRFHRRLSTETTYFRFFSVHPQLSPDEIQRFTHVDHRDREALVATVDGEIVGIARFDRLDDPADAEVAFVVADAWQGHGIGTLLFEQLAVRARELGVRRFVADTLPHNHRMLAVFHHVGLPVRSAFRDGVVHLTIDLTPHLTKVLAS